MDVEDLNIGRYLIPGGAKSNVAVHIHQYYSGVPLSDVTTPMSNIGVMSNLPPSAGNTNSGRWDSITTVSNPSTPGLMQTVTSTPPQQSSQTTPNPGGLVQFHSNPTQQQSSASASTTPLLDGYYQAQQQANSMSSSQENPQEQTHAQAQAPVASSHSNSAPTDYFQGTIYQQYLQQQQQYQPQQQQQEQQPQQYQPYQPFEVEVNHSTPPPGSADSTTCPETEPRILPPTYLNDS